MVGICPYTHTLSDWLSVSLSSVCPCVIEEHQLGVSPPFVVSSSSLFLWVFILSVLQLLQSVAVPCFCCCCLFFFYFFYIYFITIMFLYTPFCQLFEWLAGWLPGLAYRLVLMCCCIFYKQLHFNICCVRSGAVPCCCFAVLPVSFTSMENISIEFLPWCPTHSYLAVFFNNLKLEIKPLEFLPLPKA